MNTVIEKVKAKYPEYANVPDDELTQRIGKKFPQYLEVSDFKADFDRLASKAPPTTSPSEPASQPQPVTESSSVLDQKAQMAAGTLDTDQEPAPVQADHQYLSTDIPPKPPTEPVDSEKAQTAARVSQLLRSAKTAMLQKDKAEQGSSSDVLAKALEHVEGLTSKLANPLGAILEFPEHLWRSLGVDVPTTSKAPLISPETTEKAIRAVTGGFAEDSFGQAAQEFGAELASSMTSPEMVGYLMLAKQAPTPIGRYFQGQMLTQLPESIKAVADAQTGKDEKKALLGVAANVAFPAMIEAGMAKATPHAMIERAKDVGPATAAAMGDVAPGQKALDKLIAEAPASPVEPSEVKVGEQPKPEPETPPVEPPASKAEPSVPIPAIRMKDGTVHEGKPGQIHAQVAVDKGVEFEEIQDRGVVRDGKYEQTDAQPVPKQQFDREQKLREAIAAVEKGATPEAIAALKAVAGDKAETKPAEPATEVPKADTKNLMVTVAAEQKVGDKVAPGYVQIDEVLNRETGETRSGMAKVLKEQGVEVPDFSKLPQGQYPYEDAVKMLKGEEPAGQAARPAPPAPLEAPKEPVAKQSEPLALVGEKGVDPERVAAEKASAEAKAQAGKEGTQEFVGMGGATPAEFELSAKTPTGIKNATVDQERVKRGLPAAMQPARRTFGNVWDQAMARIDQDPGYTDRLLRELRDEPRALSDIEDATLLHRQIELQNEYGKATRELAQAFDDGRVEDVADQKVRVAGISDQLLDIYDIGKASGTETGRGLAARKMMAYEDFSLAKMELEKRAAKGGEQLTDTERSEVTELNRKIEATQKAYDDYVAATEERLRQMEIDRAYREVTGQRAEPVLDARAKSLADRLVEAMEKQANVSREYLKGKLFTISPDVLFHLSRIGAAQIARGVLDFSRWSGAMIGEFGDRIQPYLQEVYDASSKFLDTAVEKAAGKKDVRRVRRSATGEEAAEKQASITAGIREKITANETDGITPLVQKLARLFVEQGVKERDPLIDAVHGVLKGIDPEITRREAMDAISGYGKYAQLTKDQISVELRDLKGQMQQVAKLEDIQERQPPLKTGVERRIPSDEERRLIKLVNEAKRRFGIVVTDPATQLRSALESRKTYYRNQIADLESQIAAKEKFIKEKTPSPTDTELETLKTKAQALRTEFDDIFGKPGLTDAQRLEAMQKHITELEAKIAAGDASTKPAKVSRPFPPELEQARQRIEALNKQLAELRKKPEDQKAADRLVSKIESLQKRIAEKESKIATRDLSPSTRQPVNRPLQPELEVPRQRLQELTDQLNEMREAANPKKTPEERALQTLKARLKTSIAKMEDQLSRGDFSKKEPVKPTLDAEAQRLSFEAANTKAKWLEGLMKDRLARRSVPQKILGGIGEVLNTSRALLTSLDLSAVLRQGGFIAFGHPIRALKAFPAMFRALKSEAGQHAVNQEILARKNYPLYQRSKLYLAEHGHKLSQMEEAYMSRWADKIPLVGASQRAYVTFLNKLRADSFDAMVNTLGRDGEVTPVEAKAIANFVNVATGRGKLGLKDNAAVGLNAAFFAPRYVASRFQLIAGQPLYGGTGRTRTMIAKEYARYLIGLGVVYGLGTLAGGEIEEDPRSSDFGKLRFGDTRLDPLSGIQQATVLLSRLGSGEVKRLSGEIKPIRGEDVPFGGDDAADVTARFLRTKLSPVVGTGVNLLSGKDVVGQPVTPQSAAENLLVPLALKDIYNTMVAQGVPKGTAMAILSIFGMGLQTYEPTP